MSRLKDQVRKFYEVIWNAYDKSAIPSVLHENCIFRGSLGQQKSGHEGFAEYANMVHQALGHYQCIIDELLEEDNKVFAKMKFSGIHKGEFMGYPPTDKVISWVGCALFVFNEEKMLDIWVLGDLKGLEEQLKINSA